MKTKHTIATGMLGMAAWAAGALGAENMVGGQTQNEGFFAVPAKQAPAIDGDLSDWDVSGQILSYRDTSVKGTYSVKTAAMWDADNLYLSFDWRDPTPLNSQVNPEQDPGRGWQADAEQLRVLSEGDDVRWLTFWSYQGQISALEYVQRLIPPGKNVLEKVLIAKAHSPDVGMGVQSAYQAAADGAGFVHEVKIPWNLIFTDGRKMAAGGKIRLGMEFLWGNPQGKGSPSHRCVDNMQPGVLTREFYWDAKNAWGDLTLIDRSVEKMRRYVPDTAVAVGTIPIDVEVPASASFFTVAIDDAQGNRVRNLVGGADPEQYAVGEPKNGIRKLRVMWDGLDDLGAVAAPGTFTVRGLVLDGGLQGKYEQCFYNPGTPPWATGDGRGGWGADHTPVKTVLASGDRVILVCGFAEGGSGTFAIGSEGRKIWGEVKGASVAAANAKHVFSIPNDWSASGSHLLRLNSETGKFRPFERVGKTLPMPYPLADLYDVKLAEGEKPLKVLAMAATDEVLALLREDGKLLVVDPETAEVRKTIDFPIFEDGVKAFGLKGETIFWFAGRQLRTLHLGTGETGTATLKKAPEKPVSLTFDDEGNLYVADAGKDMQIKKYAPDGKLLAVFGKRGGRPETGKFESDGLAGLSSVAVDASGNVWAAEYTRAPRRVSVWAPGGKFLRDYIGNTPYAASSSYLHDDDPARAYVEGNEILLDSANRSWRVDGTVWTPDASRTNSIGSAAAGNGSGQVFFSDASGKKREYFFAEATFGSPLRVFMRVGPAAAWRPVCGIFDVTAFLTANIGGNYYANRLLPPPAEFADCDPADVLIWTDRNGDGMLQRKECEIVPAAAKTVFPDPASPRVRGKPGKSAIATGGIGWSRKVDRRDLGFYASGEEDGLWKVVPDSFTGAGVPLFSSRSWKEVPLKGWRIVETCPVPGSDTVVAIGSKSGTQTTWFLGFDSKTGAIQWKYPSFYHHVHGSHKAPMATPGLLIGPLKICGAIPNCGEAPGVFMTRGNLGEDYWLTTDGLYVSPFFKDGRLPAPDLPGTEEELISTPIEMYSGGGEHFCGWVGRQNDGVIRMSCGLPRQAAMIVRMEGLDGIRYLKNRTLDVTATQLVEADQSNAVRRAASSKTPEARIAHVLRDKRGNLDWGKAGSIVLRKTGMAEQASVRMGYDATNLYVNFEVRDASSWLNGAAEAALLFKGGDAVEIQISPAGNKTASAVSGDVRFLCAPFKDTAAVLEMREKAAGAKPFGSYRYSSPVSTFDFEQVGVTDRVKSEVVLRDGNYRVTLSIPWTEIGLTPKPGLKLRGDVGIIYSDTAGKMNVSRVYWANQNTGLVNDIPNEAKLNPGALGDWVLD